MGFITRIGVFVWLAIILFSCSEEDSHIGGVHFGKKELQSNEPIKVGTNIILELIKVNDSRCPVGVVCYSAGVVDLTFEVYDTNTSFEKTISFSPLKLPVSDTIDNIVVYINDVRPDKYPDDEIQLEDYRIAIETEIL